MVQYQAANNVSMEVAEERLLLTRFSGSVHRGARIVAKILVHKIFVVWINQHHHTHNICDCAYCWSHLTSQRPVQKP